MKEKVVSIFEASVSENSSEPSYDKKNDLTARQLSSCSSSEARELVPYDLAMKYRALPLGLMRLGGHEYLSVASSAKESQSVSTALRFASGKEVRIISMDQGLVLQAIFQAYCGDNLQLQTSAQKLALKTRPINQNAQIDLPAPEGEAAKFLQSLIDYCFAHSVSDLHITPYAEGAQIKVRLNGELLNSAEDLVSNEYHLQIINRIKILACLDSSQHHHPQDGSFLVKLPYRSAQIRVSIMPTYYGEKAVLRFLGAEGSLRLSSLQLNHPTYEMIDSFLRKNEGTMLVAGPTGSGKTTTLYALVSELSLRNLNVVTVEDPVELVLPGISQTSLSEKQGLTYAACLRAILRQDPDAILIGEIRDAHSAEIALQAALTGHLVLSTVHARTVFEVLLRLRHLGVDMLTISQALDLIVCQRLIPTLCEYCKVIDLKHSQQHGFDVFRKVGCAKCAYTGYGGKLLLTESLVFDAPIRNAIIHGHLESEYLKKELCDSNYCTPREAYEQALKQGIVEMSCAAD